jgi:hypothetical protein
LYAIESFMLPPRPWAQAFLQSRTYDVVARALLRHLKAGPNYYTPGILLLEAFAVSKPFIPLVVAAANNDGSK